MTSSSNSPTGLTIEVYVRDLASHGIARPPDSVLSQLERLQSMGIIDDFTVSVWGQKLRLDSPASRTEPGKQILETVAEFEMWANQHGISLDGFSERQSINSMFTDESYNVLVLPLLTVAEYRNDELQFVAPCTDGEATITVEDRLNVLRESTGQAPVETIY